MIKPLNLPVFLTTGARDAAYANPGQMGRAPQELDMCLVRSGIGGAADIATLYQYHTAAWGAIGQPLPWENMGTLNGNGA